MNWEAIGAVGEVLGAVGVVVTLAYLAVQIRANTRTMRAESRRAQRASSRDVNLHIAADSELARIFNEGLKDPSKLDATESVQFRFILAEMVAVASETFEEARSGVGDQEYQQVVLVFLRAPGGREWWQRYGKVFNPEFQAYVNQSVLPK